MFISYTNNGDGAPGKGFSASFTFGKKLINFYLFVQLNPPVEGRMEVG